jgi:hypothetical protein
MRQVQHTFPAMTTLSGILLPRMMHLDGACDISTLLYLNRPAGPTTPIRRGAAMRNRLQFYLFVITVLQLLTDRR